MRRIGGPAALLMLLVTGPGSPAAPSAAYLVLDLATSRVLESSRPDVLDTPVRLGSLAKVATLAAALDSGAIAADTRIVCRRHLVLDGHRFTCSHPEIARPLTPAEALGHSCNYYFASVASRLRRDAFNHALASLQLAPAAPGVSMALAALGLEGVQATPRQLLSSFIRAVSGPAPSLSARSRPVVIEGLRLAAREGTARILGDTGIDALAKTGTSPMPGGGYLGLVVAVSPSDRPTRAIVVVAPGAAGMDAAAIAAARLRGDRRAPAGAARTILRIGRADRQGYKVTSVDLEDYVAGVVAAEAAPGSGAHARRALAIVARTFAWTGRGRHEAEGFDLCDLTHCQVFGRASEESLAAAAATAGEVLFYRGRPAQLYYTASCGGRSERPSAVWPGAADPPFLTFRAERECRDARWTSEISAPRLLSAMRRVGFTGDVIHDLRVLDRTGSGRVARLAVDGLHPAEIGGEAFRLAVGRGLGWQLVKSTAFDVERTAAGYRLRGTGSGHGVGLCLVGAARMAASGRSADEILAAYFPGTVRGALSVTATAVGRPRLRPALAATPRIEIRLPAGEERERPRAEDVARRAMGRVAAKSGLPAPERLHIVFHPTAAAFTRATGQPWWTAGASRGARIDLVPPATLRERSLFERTLSHEVAHVMIGGRLEGRPRWVQEAAAMYLAGELDTRGTAPTHPRAVCPPDDAFTRSQSLHALREAYVQAADCFAAQLSAGRPWDAVK